MDSRNKDIDYYFVQLWCNYSLDEMNSSHLPKEEREKILGDYEVILAKMERVLGKDRLENMKKNFSKQQEKYGLDFDRENTAATEPHLVFKKIFEELQKEEIRQMNNKKSNFVEDLGRLMKKYDVLGVEKMYFNKDAECIKVQFESGAVKLIDVACDSEWGMIIDIGKQLEKNEYTIKPKTSPAAQEIEKYEVSDEEQEYDI